MKIKIDNSLKELLNEKFSINYDDYEVFYATTERGYVFRFILKNSKDQFMLIDFNFKNILLVRQIKPFYSKNSEFHLGFETVKSMFYFPNFKVINFTDNNSTINSYNYNMALETEFLVYLQLCDFNDLQQELAQKINYTNISTLKMEPYDVNKGGFIIWKYNSTKN